MVDGTDEQQAQAPAEAPSKGKPMGRKLDGMKEICAHVRRSESTVLSWIRDLGFPAKKVGGAWVSTTDRVDRWWEQMLDGR
jgi:hypothetical protein